VPSPRIGVVGATGAVGTVTLELLAARGFDDLRAFASSRSVGRTVRFGDRELLVEEASPEALASGGLDLCFFSVGTATNLRLTLSDGEHFVAAKAVDEAGNFAVDVVTFRVDTGFFSPTGPFSGVPLFLLLEVLAVGGVLLVIRRRRRRRILFHEL